MQLTMNQMRDTIYRVLKKMNDVRPGMYSQRALMTLTMIAAHESLRGMYRIQQDAKHPALSLYQIERKTHDSIWENSDTIWQVAEALGYVKDFNRLQYDDEYATFVARHYLAMDTNPLPTTAGEASVYCKNYWNGPGEATALEYLTDYAQWCWESQ